MRIRPQSLDSPSCMPVLRLRFHPQCNFIVKKISFLPLLMPDASRFRILEISKSHSHFNELTLRGELECWKSLELVHT